jgi:hypothetical protein
MMIPEMDLSRAPWRTSTHSGDASNCVQAVVIEVPTSDRTE